MMKSLKKVTAIVVVLGTIAAAGSAFAMPRGHRHIDMRGQRWEQPRHHTPHNIHGYRLPQRDFRHDNHQRSPHPHMPEIHRGSRHQQMRRWGR